MYFHDITDSWKAEVTPPTANSRFDFALTRKNAEQQSVAEYMEVKSVTLAEENKAAFFLMQLLNEEPNTALELARLADNLVYKRVCSILCTTYGNRTALVLRRAH